MIPQEVIDELVRVNLYSYVTDFYQDVEFTENTKTTHQGLCPFHKEKTPSFTIFENTNTYKCFGCGEYGNIINFVMKKEEVGFKEACKLIGDNSGIEVVTEKLNPNHEKYKDEMTAHMKRYNAILRDNKVAYDYFKKRGITDKTIDQFMLGYVPTDEFKRRKAGDISGRINFPIFEHKDIKIAKVLGSGYRRLDGIKEKKYVNDVNQDGREGQDKAISGVFIKGECLYGFPFAHKSIRQSKFAIVTEGYMDVISMHQAGLTNTVGIMSTSFTEAQMDTLRRLTSNLIFFLDGDSAGVNNMIKYLPMLYKKGFNVKIFLAPNGQDPADICLTNNFDMDAISKLLFNNAKLALGVIIDREADYLDNILATHKIRILKTITPLLDAVPGKEERLVFESILYKRLDMR